MSTQLTRNDIKFEHAYAHKTLTLDRGSVGVSTISFLSGSNNITSSTTASSYYVSIDHLYYGTFNQSHYGSGVLPPYYTDSHYGDYPQHKNKFYSTGTVISIPQQYFGDKIRKNSFKRIITC